MSAPKQHPASFLDRAEIMTRLLPDAVMGRDVRVLAETDSTNDLSRRAGEAGAAEGLVFFAESQRRGRGRRGRVWESPAGLGLWFSVLLRPRAARERWSRLALLLALAVAEGLEEALPSLRVTWKWPNDLELGGRKVAGLLLEGNDGFVVAGVGINALHEEADFPSELRSCATSLKQAATAPVRREAVAAAVLSALDRHWRSDWAGPGFDAVISALAIRSSILGEQVTLLAGGREVAGVAEMLDSDGRLGMLLPGGSRVLVAAGEVQQCRLS